MCAPMLVRGARCACRRHLICLLAPPYLGERRSQSSGVTQPNHPLDMYFNELIARRRAEVDLGKTAAVLGEPASLPPAVLAATYGADAAAGVVLWVCAWSAGHGKWRRSIMCVPFLPAGRVRSAPLRHHQPRCSADQARSPCSGMAAAMFLRDGSS